PCATFALFEAMTTKPCEARCVSSTRYRLGLDPVPLPHVITGWQSPPCARSAGRKSVKATGGPPSAPTPAAGPTLFSVTVANGPATEGSAVGQAPTVHAVPVPLAPLAPLAPPVPAVAPPCPPPPAAPVVCA